jgi:hypothetical protein
MRTTCRSSEGINALKQAPSSACGAQSSAYRADANAQVAGDRELPPSPLVDDLL